MKALYTLALIGAAALAHAEPSPRLGTAVIGEQEAAIGLFIAPWQEDAASTIDRPPRLYDVPLAPVDPAGFAARVEAWQGLEDQRRSLLSR